MPLNQPRFIGSASPFKQWSEKYLAAGFAPIPLPPGKKNPPPTGWTGHGRPVPDEQQNAKWLNETDKCYWYNPDKQKSEPYDIGKANIALRLNTIEVDGKLYDIVGIDVDHHPDDKDDPKDGGTQLDYLEKKFGKLPDTWTSSARVNGIAGIRFYLVPAGLMWRGDCGHAGPDIDIISKNYRFAVCFPSTNPDANNRQYWWYPPGFKPDGDLDAIDRQRHGLIPDPKKLPLLPDSWIDFLTQNRIKDIGVPMDMDSTSKQLTRWASKNFAPNQSICEYMAITLDKWKLKLDDSAKSHNVLTAAHYHILKCGAEEGHNGWGKTVGEFEKYYVSNVLARGKRRAREAQKEVERSRFGALRRIKGAADEAAEKGTNYFARVDECDRPPGGGGEINVDPPKDVGRWPISDSKRSPKEYAMNDDGNGEQFLDIHEGLVRYVPNVLQKWMVWDGTKWVVDEKNVVARYLYRRVKERQIAYAEELKQAWLAVQGTPLEKERKALYHNWNRFSLQSGMVRDIDRALQAASAVREGVAIKYEELDNDRRALGCSNGVVRVTKSGDIEVVENSKELLITKNTGRPYIPLKQQKTEGKKLFKDFLDKFVAGSGHDLEYFQKLCGSVVLGDNSEKRAIFFHGVTDTCKSTMLELMIRSMGDYADTRQPDIFKSKVLNPQLAHALSLRLVGVSELGDNTINSELFKNITGGERITVELKGSNNLISAVPQFTLIVTTNGVPNVPGEDTAFRNRLLVCEFTRQATDLDKLSGNQQKLYEQGLDAVLAWLIEGAAKYTREGLLPIPVHMQMATEEFTSKLSDIAEFVEEWIMPNPDGIVRNEDLYLAFERWADKNNFNKKGWSNGKLTSRLKGMGYKQTVKRLEGQSKSQRVWVGISLIGGEIHTGSNEESK